MEDFYQTNEELQKAVESRLRCKFSDEIWQANLPLEYPPFDKDGRTSFRTRIQEGFLRLPK